MQPQKLYDVIFTGELVTAEPYTTTNPNWAIKELGHLKKVSPLPTIDGKPYITGSSIRGALRRAATLELFALTGGRRFDPDALLFTALGGVMRAKTAGANEAASEDDADDADTNANEEAEDSGKGKGKGKQRKKDGPPPLSGEALAEIRRHNPVVELFGSMEPRQIAGCVAVSHGLLVEDDAAPLIGWSDGENVQPLITGNRTDMMMRDPDLIANVATDAFEQEFRMQNALAVKRSAIATEQKAAISARFSAHKAGNKQAEKAADAQAKALGKQFDAIGNVNIKQVIRYPFITTGVHFKVTFRLMRVSGPALALFTRALDRFAAYPRLGGHAAQGMGLMNGHWSIRKRPGDDALAAPVEIGSVEFKGDDYSRAVWTFENPDDDLRKLALTADAIDYLPEKDLLTDSQVKERAAKMKYWTGKAAPKAEAQHA